MLKHLRLSALVVAVTAALLPATATAENYEVATGVGWRCTANTVVPHQTLLVGGKYSTTTLRTTTEGILTGWGIAVAPGVGPLPQQLVVFKPLGNGVYRKVAESRFEMVSPGSNSFNVRIPVDGGESVGLFGPNGTLACNGEAETRESNDKAETLGPKDAISLLAEGGTFTGSDLTFQSETGLGTPLSTSVDNDEDGDGYGDQGQDRCPGSGSKGHDCPIGVHITRVEVRRRAILLEVTPKAFARIWLRGEFRYRVRPDRPGNPTSPYSVDSRTRRKEVRADSSEIFRVPIPPRIPRLLDRLPRGKSLLARISVFITDRHGWENEERMKIVLRSRR